MAKTQPLMEDACPIDALCMACEDSKCDFKPMAIKRRPLGPKDVLIDMKYCGVCHSDLHFAANHMGHLGAATKYPIVPGHELAGICTAVGSEVSKIKVGDYVGVGCLVDSCLECKHCKGDEEQWCQGGLQNAVPTFNGPSEKYGRSDTFPKGGHTLGGYSTKFVVTEHFAIKVPQSYPLEAAGPVMCAGITVWDPLRKSQAGPGTKVGIVGLGGLGVMGIKLAKALGCTVTAISSSDRKKDLAAKAGAGTYLNSSMPEELTAHEQSLDLILNTVPSEHDYVAYAALLNPHGTQVLLGGHSGTVGAMLNSFCGCCCLAGKPVHTFSGIGGIKAHQELIDFCDEHKILPELEIRPVWELPKIYEALDASNQSGTRYVLDISTLNDGTAQKCVLPPPSLRLDKDHLPSVGRILRAFFRQLANRVLSRVFGRRRW